MVELDKQIKKPLDQMLSGAKEREIFFRQIVEHMGDAVVIVDRKGFVRSLNPAAEHIFATSPKKMVGQKFAFAVHSGKPGFRPIPIQQVKIERREKDALNAEIRVEEIKLRGATYFMANIRDITELVKLREEKRDLPLIDEFTGLYNQRGLITVAQYQLKMAEQTKKGMWVIVLDLDNLGKIIDILGQNEGKKAILAVVDVLRGTFRASDVIARITENQFAIIAIGALKNSSEALDERLNEKTKDQNEKGNHRFKLSINIGMSYYEPEKPCTIDELLVRAKENMQNRS